MNSFEIDAVVTVDARGQLVLPKDIRRTFGLDEGGKLALVVMQSGGRPCCISLMPVGSLSASVGAVLQPVFHSEEETK